jgi:branched-chain amino acid transport system substrate-binding protein
MKSRVLFGVLIVFALALAACAPAATEAPAEPVAPVEPAPTEAPAEPVAFECTDAIGCVDIAPGDPIHLAYALSVSGATAALGEDARGAIEIAMDDVGGELLGHPISLTGEDTLCNAEGGQAAGTKLAADPTIVAIVGTTCSSEARAAMPQISQAGMVMMSASNTNPDLTNPDHPDHWPGYFRTATNDIFQGRIAAEFAYNELGVTKAATLHDGSPYAESLQQVFTDVFTELGGTVTAQEAINVGDTDMTGVMTSIAAGAPEMLYFPIFEPEGGFVADQAKSTPGLEEVILMGADGLLANTFPANAGPAAIGMYLSSPSVSGPEYDALLAKWQAKFGAPPPSGYHAMAYDATNIFFQAIEAVAVVDADGTVHVPRQALRDYLYALKDYPGLTGNLACDANGDCATGEALGVFQLTEAEVTGGNWPPEVVWSP